MTTEKYLFITISATASIKDALEKINQNGLQICFVLNKHRKLIGSVSDGDVRRFLLRNGSIEDVVTNVMNPQTITTNIPMSNHQALNYMRNKSILVLPFIDNDDQIIEFYIAKELSKPIIKQNPIFIMAGGFGTRLRPLTDTCPKPMLHVGGKPLLEIIISHFKQQGFVNFFISTHYLPEIIYNYFGNGENFDIRIEYIYENKPLGTGGALSLLPQEKIDLPIIVINGDVLTNMNFNNLLNFHNKNNAMATICTREYQYQIPYGVVNSTNNVVLNLLEKPAYYYNINTGIYVISPELLNQIPSQYIDMPTVIEQQIQNNKKVISYHVHDYWLDIGQIDDYNRAQRDILNLNLGN